MFDGSLNINTMDEDAYMQLRASYLSRLRDGAQVPLNMKSY
jgi:hypothetical protein